MLTQLLLPPLVWRAGKTAAAVRFAAMTALATMLRRQLVPVEALLQLAAEGKLLPLLHQCLDEVGQVLGLGEAWAGEGGSCKCYGASAGLWLFCPALLCLFHQSVGLTALWPVQLIHVSLSSCMPARPSAIQVVGI